MIHYESATVLAFLFVFQIMFPQVLQKPYGIWYNYPSVPSVLPDGYLSGEGFVLLLDLELGCFQAQGFPALRLLDAAIA